ncbi:MAG TPA: hypothetical protein VJS64_03330 [Pyrinomonadaceae bacterium]|nr:hypothetical protein [Pyrinomonadaceae bacterium]
MAGAKEIFGGVLPAIFGEEGLGKLTLGAIAGFATELGGSAFEKLPETWSKEHHYDLGKALATAYLESLEHLASETKSDELKEQFAPFLRLWRSRINRSLEDETVSFLFVKQTNDGSFTPRQFILNLAEPDKAESLLADDVVITLQCWAGEETTYEKSGKIRQLGLSTDLPLPESLRAFLRAEIPMEIAHRFGQVVRRSEFKRSWIAFQQAHLLAINLRLRQLDTSTMGLIEKIGSLTSQQQFLETLAEEMAEFMTRARDQEAVRERHAEEIIDRLLYLENRLGKKIEQSKYEITLVVRQVGDEVKEEIRQQRSQLAKAAPQQRLYFDHLIDTHTRLFAGRESYLEAIRAFTATNQCGYLFIEALSGYGKTSLLAKLVKENPNFAYHFISQAYKSHGSDFDPTEIESFLSNLCEQLQMGNVTIDGKLSPRAQFHSLLRTSPENGRRVIVIDAVDEINKHPNYLLGLFPETLPLGVFVILSARKLGDRNYLSEIGLRIDDLGKIIELPGLDENAISQLLRLVGGQAVSLADSKNFIGALYEVSNPDPFYLHFLVEDIAQGIITPQNIERVPSKLNEYLDTQLSILDRSAHLPQQRDILGIILEAYGPISRVDIINMVEGLDGLNFNNVVRDTQRFLLLHDDIYTFCHSRFKEYFMSKVF